VPTLIYGHRAAPNTLEVVCTDVRFNNWPSGTSDVRVGFLSDVHCESDISVSTCARAAIRLMEQRPDLVLLGGDYLSFHSDPWTARCAEALAPVSAAPLGAFGVLGNHDWWSHAQVKLTDAFAAVGITVLSDRALPVTPGGDVWLIGLDFHHLDKFQEAASLVSVPEDAFKLLLVHQPDYADSVHGDVDIQFSGHTHAGQVRLFGRPIILPPGGRRYPQGLQQAKTHLVYTTRGIGTTGIRFRFGCRPEVSVITLGAQR